MPGPPARRGPKATWSRAPESPNLQDKSAVVRLSSVLSVKSLAQNTRRRLHPRTVSVGSSRSPVTGRPDKRGCLTVRWLTDCASHGNERATDGTDFTGSSKIPLIPVIKGNAEPRPGALIAALMRPCPDRYWRGDSTRRASTNG